VKPVSVSVSVSITIDSVATEAEKAERLDALKSREQRTIGLFGSSVNPPTPAHVAIVAALAARCDEVWVLPVYSHSDVGMLGAKLKRGETLTEEEDTIFKKKSGLPKTFDLRCTLCRLAFEGFPNVFVKTYEKELSETFRDGYPGTEDLVRYFINQSSLNSPTSSPRTGQVHEEGGIPRPFRPDFAQNNQYVFAMGQDTMNSYVKGDWGGRELERLVTLLRIKRDGEPLHKEAEPFEELQIEDGFSDVSSTKARKAWLAHDADALKKNVSPAVAKYLLTLNKRDAQPLVEAWSAM